MSKPEFMADSKREEKPMANNNKHTPNIPGMKVDEVRETIGAIEGHLIHGDLARYVFDLARQVVLIENKPLTPERLAFAVYEDTKINIVGATAILHYLLSQHFDLRGESNVTNQ